jgi:hypothetical protein
MNLTGKSPPPSPRRADAGGGADAPADNARAPASAIPSPEAAPFTDRLSAADKTRYRDEYEQAAAARNATLAMSAPWWRRALALLPNPQRPLQDWIEKSKARLRNRL